MLLESFLINGFHAYKHVPQTELFPKGEHLLVTKEDIASSLQVILFLDPLPGDGFAYVHTVFGLNECHIVHDEDAGLLDSLQLFHHLVRACGTIATPIKGPCTAEGTIPRAASRELDRRTRVQDA